MRWRSSLPRRPLLALQLLADGYSMRQIRERMKIGKSGVSQALWWARQRLGAESNGHAVAIALREGLIH